MSSGAPLPPAYSIKRHVVSLTNCDDEPVRTPGCIQAHGLLLALRPSDLVVTQVSDNCQRWCGLALEQVLAQPLAHIVGPQAALRIRQLSTTTALGHNPSFALSARLPHAAADAAAMDMTVHAADGVLLLELEPDGRAAALVMRDGDYFAKVRHTLGSLKATRSLAEFCHVVAREARGITGLDRAMVYRFHADASGEVVADARRDDLPSWQGLRYPAADIPRPAREIFKRIGVRPLPDAHGELCEMVPLLNPDSGRPLDMTHCALRGASVMYTEYLHNMGVAATLTMPIIRDGELWGLIACHHDTATEMPHAMRSAAELLGQIASLEIAQAEAREHQLYRGKLDAVNLAKPASLGEMGLRLTPRRSFDLWQEQVRGRSRPWLEVEIEAARSLRRMVMELVAMLAEQLAELNAELASSNAELDAFTYLAGHDLKEPLRGIRAYTQQLLDDVRAGRSQDATRLDWLLTATGRLDTLLDGLLRYSRLGHPQPGVGSTFHFALPGNTITNTHIAGNDASNDARSGIDDVA
jgi:light-regulated signal transduction histidine kinase (bacteriophytochrome)